MIAIGFDPSLTSFGISDCTSHGAIRTTPDRDTLARVDDIMIEVAFFVAAREAVWVYEGPSIGSAMAGALWDAGYLRARIDLLAREHGAVIYTVPPSTLKKFVTGKGNTPKADMALKVWKKWAIDFADDKGGDKLHAYCLARYGQALLAGEIVHEAPKPRGQGQDRRAAARASARTRAAMPA